MYEKFQRFGEVDEVIIPTKKDIRGRRYGFVRFFGVNDAKMLVTKLDNIFMGKQKLFVNIPRF